MSKRKKWVMIGGAALLGLVLIAVAVSRPGKDDTPAEEARPVTTVTVGLEKLNSFAELSGTLSPIEEASVSFEVAGRISEMYRQEGDQVKSGEALAEMNATEYSLQLAQAKNGLEKAQVGYQKAKDDFARMDQMYKSGILSPSDFESARDRLTVAERDLALAEQSYSLVSEGKNRLKAPISGTVIAKLASVGQLASSNAPVYRIGKIDQLKVLLPVPDSEIAGWKLGDSVTLLLYNQTREGTVTRVMPTTSQGTGAIGAEVTVDNAERDWFAGQVVRARRITDTREGIFLPVEAVLNHGGEKPYVFLGVEDRAVKTPVTIGRLMGNKLEILDGVALGDQVIVKGSNQVFNGSLIKRVEVGQ
ncbi:MAG: efflux RND transporter periplasmic adaptor subunit [Firmicutes bacterium]|nr:efflux RND transporter periplasmic adaptor subunit [Bacillota bacterium]